MEDKKLVAVVSRECRGFMFVKPVVNVLVKPIVNS